MGGSAARKAAGQGADPAPRRRRDALCAPCPSRHAVDVARLSMHPPAHTCLCVGWQLPAVVVTHERRELLQRGVHEDCPFEVLVYAGAGAQANASSQGRRASAHARGGGGGGRKGMRVAERSTGHAPVSAKSSMNCTMFCGRLASATSGSTADSMSMAAPREPSFSGAEGAVAAGAGAASAPAAGCFGAAASAAGAACAGGAAALGGMLRRPPPPRGEVTPGERRRAARALACGPQPGEAPLAESGPEDWAPVPRALLVLGGASEGPRAPRPLLWRATALVKAFKGGGWWYVRRGCVRK